MRCLIILLLSTLPLTSPAQEGLRWYPNPARFPEGECVRMHVPSGGDSYVEKVKPEECRPEKTTFLWKDGLCYEVDSESGGKGFALKTTPASCAPTGSLFSFNEQKRECWLVDPSGGLTFKARLDVKECRPLEENLVKKFFPAPNGAGGDCLEVHRTEGSARWSRRLNASECRPLSTRFSWRVTGNLTGECWELASDGPEYYSNKVGNRSCRPEQVSYIFERTGEMRGDCYEVDVETKGQGWAQKVAPSNCRTGD